MGHMRRVVPGSCKHCLYRIKEGHRIGTSAFNQCDRGVRSGLSCIISSQ